MRVVFPIKTSEKRFRLEEKITLRLFEKSTTPKRESPD